MFKVFFGNVNIGGSETLILRILKKILYKGIGVKLYCNKINENALNLFESNDVEVCVIGSGFYGSFLKELNDSDTLMVFGIQSFMACNNYIRKKNINCQFFLYIVHPYTTILFRNKQILNIVFGKEYRKIVQRGINNGIIAFMDEQCLNYAIKHMNLEISPDIQKECIIRLLLDNIANADFETIEKKAENRKDSFEILSVARADFPFKGYMRGLINQFSELKVRYPNIKLNIVSARDDVYILKSWIEEKAAKGVHDITLHLNVPYDELKKHYKKAHLYVGMGTTILEAASYGTISIAVAPYTYECNADCYFHQKPNWVLTEIGEGNDIKPLIEKIILLEDNEYKIMGNKTIEVFNDTYNSEKIVAQIINFNSNKNTIDLGFVLSLYTLLYMGLFNLKVFLRRLICR